MFSLEIYRNIVRNNFEMNRNVIVDKLKQISELKFNSNVKVIDFVIYDYVNEMSIVMFSLDCNANEVFSEVENLFAGSLEIITDFTYFEVSDQEEKEYDKFRDIDENAGELERIVTQETIKWLSDCWEEAKMQGIKIPSYITFHDDIQSYDLQIKKWINDNEK